MKLRFQAIFSFALLGMSCLALPNIARADSYQWTYQGILSNVPSGALNFGSGELTTTNGVISELSGTFDGLAIAGLLPPGAFAGNDNLLVVPPAPLFVTLGGFSFVDSAGTEFNIYAALGTQCSCGPSGCVCIPHNLYGATDPDGLESDVGNFTLTANIPTPEPAAIALLLPALLCMGLLLACRRFRNTGIAARSSLDPLLD